jgi:prophage antirepressor-like protein
MENLEMNVEIVQVFNNPQFGNIRIATNEQGEALFCLPDLCKAVGLTNPSSVKSRLDSGDVQLIDLHALNYTEGIGDSMANFVNESGFYDVLLQSSSPKVKPFRKWVTGEVLPSIRKHGAYITPDTLDNIISDPDFGIKLLTTLKEEKQKRLETEREKAVLEEQNRLNVEQIKLAAPKVEYHDEVLQSISLIATNVIAKELGMSAVTLNRKLHEKGVIYNSAGTWVLYQKYQERGYAGTKTHHYTDSRGDERTSVQTYWTEKGRKFIHELIRKQKSA